MSPLKVALEAIEDDCFQGVLPSPIATVSRDGVPNVTSLSIVDRVDGEHVALSRQFFNKTLANLKANPRAQVMVVSTKTGRQYKLDLVLERTEIQGQIFERMRARLEAVASHSGMAGVFRLAAVDICRVEACDLISSEVEPAEAVGGAPANLKMLEDFSRRVEEAADTDELVSASLGALAGLGYEHSVLLLLDEGGERLLTVASRGYATTGAGSELRVGDGIIGTAAWRRQTVRLSNLSRDLGYARAVHREVTGDEEIEARIALPGLEKALSEIAVPLIARNELLGVLALQSDSPARFDDDDEALLALAARQIGLALALLRSAAPSTVMLSPQPTTAGAMTMHVRHYSADDSVFIDNEYVIKGVAGQILWRLLQLHVAEKRNDFTNREIRLDSSIELSEMRDNLDSRLVLLRPRLEDRGAPVRIVRLERGRFRLEVSRPVVLEEVTGRA